MPANNTPIFPITPIVGIANISSAVTGLTVTGVTGLTLIGGTAGANGRRIDDITVQATAATTAGMVRIWYYSGSGNAQLIKEIPVSAITPSGTVAAFTSEWVPANWVIPSGAALYASTNNAEAFNIVMRAGDY